MSIDDRDYMREKTYIFGTKRTYSSSHRSWRDRHPHWKAYLIFATTLLLLTILVRAPARMRHFQVTTNAEFPATGQVRWFIPIPGSSMDTARLTIKGFQNASNHSVVQLENWDTHIPVAFIPIRGSETASVQVPLGKYRITYAPNANWTGPAQLIGKAQEAINPMVFFKSANTITGHHIDLNGHINGNMPTKTKGYF